jgi:hypothetical protein
MTMETFRRPLRHWVGALAAALALAFAMPAAAQSDPRDVIAAQIDRFLADDLAGAFEYAAPGIQRLFGTPENFGRMVRQGYPMVWRPAEVTYGAAEERGARVLQRVVITDAAGRVHTLLYEMVPDGESWRIGGVRILAAPDVGV